MTTKNEEMKALEQIRKIVKSLGENSYIASAMEGVLEDAEANIRDDAAYSMKGRLESISKELDEVKGLLTAANMTIERLELDNRDLQMAIKRVKEEDSKTISALREQVLSPDDITDCIAILEERINEEQEKVDAAAAEIVATADAPQSKEFQQAVLDHRNHKSWVDYSKAIVERLRKVEEARG